MSRKKVEEIAFNVIAKDELVGVRTITGFQSFKGGRSKTGNHYGSVEVELTMQDFRKRKTKEIVAVLGEKLKIQL